MTVFAAVQNGIILETFDTEAEALECVEAEKQKDFFSIIFKKKLRKLFKKSGNVALHHYAVMKITEVKDIK